MAQPNLKRSIDPDDGLEVPSAKKARYELKTDVKCKVLQFFALSFHAVYALYAPPASSYYNISIAVQIMNIVHTAYNICRQNGSTIKSTLLTKASAGSPMITYKGQHIACKIETIINIVTDCASISGLTFHVDSVPTARATAMEVDPLPPGIDPEYVCLPIPNDAVIGKEWFGIAGPYLNFLTGFGLRIKELRLGHSEFPIKKENNTSTSYPVSKFGLSRVHHILLEGIRFPPERRSSMV